MALHKAMQKLISIIKEPIIFFFPRSVLEEVINKDLSKLEAVGLLNTLFITNAEGETKPLSSNAQLLQVLSKEKLLKSNIFELLDLRNKLNKSAFHYLIDDYFKELSTWIKTTRSVEREAKNYAWNYKPEVQGYLKLQHQALSDHQVELKNHFGDWKSWFEIERVFNHSLFDFDKNDYKKVEFVPKIPIIRKYKTPKIKKQKSKVLTINEAEVDHYLLETVFYVDFSKVNNRKTRCFCILALNKRLFNV
jgi:hypothetical protein